jgi:hypothetical protein
MKTCIDIYQCGECLDNDKIVPKRYDRFFDEKKLFLVLGVIAVGAILAGVVL